MNKKESEITKILIAEGWQPASIDIWFDDLQGFWRWSCKIQQMYPLVHNVMQL